MHKAEVDNWHIDITIGKESLWSQLQIFVRTAVASHTATIVVKSAGNKKSDYTQSNDKSIIIQHHHLVFSGQA